MPGIAPTVRMDQLRMLLDISDPDQGGVALTAGTIAAELGVSIRHVSRLLNVLNRTVSVHHRDCRPYGRLYWIGQVPK